MYIIFLKQQKKKRKYTFSMCIYIFICPAVRIFLARRQENTDISLCRVVYYTVQYLYKRPTVVQRTHISRIFHVKCHRWIPKRNCGASPTQFENTHSLQWINLFFFSLVFSISLCRVSLTVLVSFDCSSISRNIHVFTIESTEQKSLNNEIFTYVQLIRCKLWLDKVIHFWRFDPYLVNGQTLTFKW